MNRFAMEELIEFGMSVVWFFFRVVGFLYLK